VSKKWGDLVPHVAVDPVSGEQKWIMGNSAASRFPAMAQAGWKEFPPSSPPTIEDADPASWNPVERLKRMDEYGMYAQVIYPNVGGFGSGRFLEMKEPALMLECVQAYNNFLTDWCSTDTDRLIPIMALPFWDLDATVREINRCFKLGHRGILFGNQPEYFGQPFLSDPHWNPLWATAQDLGLSINFHIGSGDLAVIKAAHASMGDQARVAMGSVMIFMDNAKAIMEVIASGICHRYPKLNFVSVESGIGWIPFAIACLDWQWINAGASQNRPEMDLMPSEYFRRQVYGCFWFECGNVTLETIKFLQDNILYETDFPHPTSMSPGPASSADVPKDFIEQQLSGLPEDVLRKILHDNSARIYHLA
jgi:predicted TIM-barrel fold metal-dependent hydrolase